MFIFQLIQIFIFSLVSFLKYFGSFSFSDKQLLFKFPLFQQIINVCYRTDLFLQRIIGKGDSIQIDTCQNRENGTLIMGSFFFNPRNFSFKVYIVKIPEGDENCLANASHVSTAPPKGSQQRAGFHAFVFTPPGCCSGQGVGLLTPVTEPLRHLSSCGSLYPLLPQLTSLPLALLSPSH